MCSVGLSSEGVCMCGRLCHTTVVQRPQQRANGSCLVLIDTVSLISSHCCATLLVVCTGLLIVGVGACACVCVCASAGG